MTPPSSFVLSEVEAQGMNEAARGMSFDYAQDEWR
jgi:hypothetical protein